MILNSSPTFSLTWDQQCWHKLSLETTLLATITLFSSLIISYHSPLWPCLLNLPKFPLLHSPPLKWLCSPNSILGLQLFLHTISLDERINSKGLHTVSLLMIPTLYLQPCLLLRALDSYIQLRFWHFHLALPRTLHSQRGPNWNSHFPPGWDASPHSPIFSISVCSSVNQLVIKL